jgi:8-oxo-dGTP diphosphatase
MKRYDVVAGIVWRGDEVLLIEQYVTGGGKSTETMWTLPSGGINKGEIPEDAVSREIMEEAGASVLDKPEKRFSCECLNKNDDSVCIAIAYEFHESAGDLVPRDPDCDVIQAKFFSVAEAIAKLETIPYPEMKEPVIDYLRTKEACHWVYEIDESKKRKLIDKRLQS